MANGIVVQRRSAKEIEAIADKVRADLELSPDGRIAMLPILEQVLYETLDGYDFRIREDREMGHMEGLTDDREPIIYMKASVYSALERGEARARMTAAHELGHLLMHCRMPTYRAFSEKYDPLYDPERQANVFAAALLMPERAFRKCKTISQAMRTFGVSKDAAMHRARKLQHKWEQPTRPILSIKSLNKKKGISKRQSP